MRNIAVNKKGQILQFEIWHSQAPPVTGNEGFIPPDSYDAMNIYINGTKIISYASVDEIDTFLNWIRSNTNTSYRVIHIPTSDGKRWYALGINPQDVQLTLLYGDVVQIFVGNKSVAAFSRGSTVLNDFAALSKWLDS